MPDPGNRRFLDLYKRLDATAAERDEFARLERHAGRIVTLWNARLAGARPSFFYPTIRGALMARRPWLRFLCPACRQIGGVDVGTLDRHPDASAREPNSGAVLPAVCA